MTYGCMSNVKKIIDTQNKRKLNASQHNPTEINEPKLCNCRNKASSPMQGKCLQQAVIYQATVKTTTSAQPTSDQRRTSSKRASIVPQQSVKEFNRIHVWSLNYMIKLLNVVIL